MTTQTQVEWRAVSRPGSHFIGGEVVESWGVCGDGGVTRFARSTTGIYFRFHSGPGAWERITEEDVQSWERAAKRSAIVADAAAKNEAARVGRIADRHGVTDY